MPNSTISTPTALSAVSAGGLAVAPAAALNQYLGFVYQVDQSLPVAA